MHMLLISNETAKQTACLTRRTLSSKGALGSEVQTAFQEISE